MNKRISLILFILILSISFLQAENIEKELLLEDSFANNSNGWFDNNDDYKFIADKDFIPTEIKKDENTLSINMNFGIPNKDDVFYFSIKNNKLVLTEWAIIIYQPEGSGP